MCVCVYVLCKFIYYLKHLITMPKQDEINLKSLLLLKAQVEKHCKQIFCKQYHVKSLDLLLYFPFSVLFAIVILKDFT